MNPKPKTPSPTLRLTDAPCGARLLIVEIQAGEETRRRLLAMGLHGGDVVQRMDTGAWGPVLLANVSTHSTKVAIGRSLARHILVRHENP